MQVANSGVCLFIVVWGTRLILADHGASLDIAVLAAFAARFIHEYLYGYEVPPSASAYYSKIIWSLSVLICLTVLGFLWQPRRRNGKAELEVPCASGSERGPLICPCRTTHTRFFPKKHGFSYSYLQVAIPVGWEGTAGSLISVDQHLSKRSKYSQSSSGRLWSLLSVSGADYLNRGNNDVGLHEKLRLYLETQNENLGDYTASWLVTAPRFLGYSFNPVSFWYLYKGSILSAMVLEVNNTFDERRMYFMKKEYAAMSPAGGNDANGENTANSDTKFTSHWAKDFHVSPFNSRKGGYTLAAVDPIFSRNASIDNNITLMSSKQHAKLVARIVSTGPALNPSSMSPWSKLRFLLSWFWVGFMTFPRIAKEAGKLFFQRKLHVWYRPEVVRQSIGRKETSREKTLESGFRLYLQHLVSTSPLKLSLSYTSPISPHPQMFKPSRSSASSTIELQVLTPAFYASFASSHDPSAFLASSLNGPDNAKTSYASDPIRLVALFLSRSTSESAEPKARWSFSPLWSLLSLLRLSSPAARVADNFVRENAPRELAAEYRGAVTALLLSNRFAFGIVEVLDLMLLVGRVWLGWKCAGWVLACEVRWEMVLGGMHWGLVVGKWQRWW